MWHPVLAELEALAVPLGQVARLGSTHQLVPALHLADDVLQHQRGVRFELGGFVGL